jgi:hypothetical protein
MGKQTIEDYVWRNAYEATVLAIVLVLAYILFRNRRERAWLLIAIASAMRLLPTIANLAPYPTAIFPVLWSMYHGSLLVLIWALLDAVVKRPNQPAEPTSGAVTDRAGVRSAPLPPVAHL